MPDVEGQDAPDVETTTDESPVDEASHDEPQEGPVEAQHAAMELPRLV